jgi:hypothetical protein
MDVRDRIQRGLGGDSYQSNDMSTGFNAVATGVLLCSHRRRHGDRNQSARPAAPDAVLPHTEDDPPGNEAERPETPPRTILDKIDPGTRQLPPSPSSKRDGTRCAVSVSRVVALCECADRAAQEAADAEQPCRTREESGQIDRSKSRVHG